MLPKSKIMFLTYSYFDEMQLKILNESKNILKISIQMFFHKKIILQLKFHSSRLFTWYFSSSKTLILNPNKWLKVKWYTNCRTSIAWLFLCENIKTKAWLKISICWFSLRQNFLLHFSSIKKFSRYQSCFK